MVSGSEIGIRVGVVVRLGVGVGLGIRVGIVAVGIGVDVTVMVSLGAVRAGTVGVRAKVGVEVASGWEQANVTSVNALSRPTTKNPLIGIPC